MMQCVTHVVGSENHEGVIPLLQFRQGIVQGQHKVVHGQQRAHPFRVCVIPGLASSWFHRIRRQTMGFYGILNG